MSTGDIATLYEAQQAQQEQRRSFNAGSFPGSGPLWTPPPQVSHLRSRGPTSQTLIQVFRYIPMLMTLTS